MTTLKLFLLIIVCFATASVRAQKLGALVQTNAVIATDTLPVTTNGGTNTFKVSVSNILNGTVPIGVNGSGLNGMDALILTNKLTQLNITPSKVAVYDALGNLTNSTVDASSLGVGSQTPLLSNVDGDGFSITNLQQLVVKKDNLGTLSLPGIILSNSLPSTAGVPTQYSPALILAGQGWQSGFNNTVQFRFMTVPISGSPLTGALYLQSNVTNSGTWFNSFIFDTSATLTCNYLTAIGDLNAGAAYSIGISSGTRWRSSANGAWEARNFANNATASVQSTIPQVTWTVNHVLTALESGLQVDNIGASATNRLDLPTAVAKMRYLGYVDAAFRMQFQATGTDIIRDGSTASGAAGGIWADAPGECIELFSPKTGVWAVRSKNGTWTVE